MFRRITATLAITGALFAISSPAMAGKQVHSASTTSCSVSGNLVSATGLPTDQVINFMLTDSSGTTGWVLGQASDGTAYVTVPDQHGPTTYAFVSRTWGANGSKYNVFASC
jgi:hypothetical protein